MSIISHLRSPDMSLISHIRPPDMSLISHIRPPDMSLISHIRPPDMSIISHIRPGGREIFRVCGGLHSGWAVTAQSLKASNFTKIGAAESVSELESVNLLASGVGVGVERQNYYQKLKADPHFNFSGIWVKWVLLFQNAGIFFGLIPRV